MLERLKSLPLTIVLTILLWMYAEAQFTATREGVAVTVRVAAPANQPFSMRLFDPVDGRFRTSVPLSITVKGPQNQVDKIYQQSLGAGPRDTRFSELYFSPKPSDLKPGADAMVDTVAVLNAMPYFHEAGLTVLAASPATLRMEVDAVRTISRPVTFRSAASTQVEINAIRPNLADVTLPQKLLTSLGENNISVFAVPSRDLAELPPDTTQIIPSLLVVEYPGSKDERVTVSPLQVNVTLKVPRIREDIVVVPGVPIWISGPPAMLSRYDVDLQPKFLQLSLTGSPAALQTLRASLDTSTATAPHATTAPDVGIHAYLDITLADHPSDTLQARKLRYTLPENVSLREAPKEISFRLIEH